MQGCETVLAVVYAPVERVHTGGAVIECVLVALYLTGERGEADGERRRLAPRHRPDGRDCPVRQRAVNVRDEVGEFVFHAVAPGRVTEKPAFPLYHLHLGAGVLSNEPSIIASVSLVLGRGLSDK